MLWRESGLERPFLCRPDIILYISSLFFPAPPPFVLGSSLLLLLAYFSPTSWQYTNHVHPESTLWPFYLTGPFSLFHLCSHPFLSFPGKCLSLICNQSICFWTSLIISHISSGTPDGNHLIITTDKTPPPRCMTRGTLLQWNQNFPHWKVTPPKKMAITPQAYNFSLYPFRTRNESFLLKECIS